MPFWQMQSDRLARLLYPQTLWFVGIFTVALLIVAVLTRIPATLPWDLRTTLYFQKYNHPVVNKAARWLTWMGNSLTLMLLSVGVFIISWIARQPEAGFFSLLSLLTLGLNVILKNTFDRQRPGQDQVAIHPGPRWGFSFPSGHSMGSAGFYGFLAFLVYLHVPNETLKALIIAPLILLPIGVGLSRVYLGAHWMSDVTAGWAGGLIVLTVLGVLYPV